MDTKTIELLKPGDAEKFKNSLSETLRSLDTTGLKSGGVLRQKPKVVRLKFISASRRQHRVAKLCQVLGVVRSAYYAREERPKSALVKQIKNSSEEKSHLWLPQDDP